VLNVENNGTIPQIESAYRTLSVMYQLSSRTQLTKNPGLPNSRSVVSSNELYARSQTRVQGLNLVSARTIKRHHHQERQKYDRQSRRAPRHAENGRAAEPPLRGKGGLEGGRDAEPPLLPAETRSRTSNVDRQSHGADPPPYRDFDHPVTNTVIQRYIVSLFFVFKGKVKRSKSMSTICVLL
jgi:hypothetical protein